MSIVKKRVDALEQAAQLFEAQRETDGPVLTVETFHRIRKAFEEIKEREGPPLSKEEQTKRFRERLERMRSNWEAGAGK